MFFLKILLSYKSLYNIYRYILEQTNLYIHIYAEQTIRKGKKVEQQNETDRNIER